MHLKSACLGNVCIGYFKLYHKWLLFSVPLPFSMEPSTSETATRNTNISLFLNVLTPVTHTHTGCVHERTVETEGEKRLLEVSQEVLEEAGDGIDIVHLAEHWNSFAAEKLLLQLLHCAIGTGQTVQSSLRGKKYNYSPFTL